MTYHMPRDDVLYSNAFFAEKDLSLSWPVQAALPANLVCTNVFCTRPHSLVGPLACPCTPIVLSQEPSAKSPQPGAPSQDSQEPLSQESSARSLAKIPQSGFWSQRASARSPQAVFIRSFQPEPTSLSQESSARSSSSQQSRKDKSKFKTI